MKVLVGEKLLTLGIEDMMLKKGGLSILFISGPKYCGRVQRLATLPARPPAPYLERHFVRP